MNLATLALASGTAALASQAAAEASIVWSGTLNQSFSVGTSGLALATVDFDGDSTNELNFGVGATTSGVHAVRFDAVGTDTRAVVTGSTFPSQTGPAKPIPTVLPSGTTVGPSGALTSSLSVAPGTNGLWGWGFQDYDDTTGLPTTSGAWAGETSQFVGLEIFLSSDTNSPKLAHYAWLRVSVPSTGTGNLTLHDWAYETVAGQSIVTGAGVGGPSAVPEPGTLQVVALGGLGLAAWRRRRQQAS